jgi:hypothetical protein
MKLINRLKILKWKARVARKSPEYVKKIPCPVCGSVLILSEEEEDKYMDTVRKSAEILSKNTDSIKMLASLPKMRPYVWIRWVCSNDTCEFNGEPEIRAVEG